MLANELLFLVLVLDYIFSFSVEILHCQLSTRVKMYNTLYLQKNLDCIVCNFVDDILHVACHACPNVVTTQFKITVLVNI